MVTRTSHLPRYSTGELVQLERIAETQIERAVNQLLVDYPMGPVIWALCMYTCRALTRAQLMPRTRRHLRWLVLKAMIRGRV